MPRAYSNDLRSKLLKAYAAGQGSLDELASDVDRFSTTDALQFPFLEHAQQ
jgi:hypothetical protein